MKTFLAAIVGLSFFGTGLARGGDFYVGGVAGLATLSADGRSVVSPAGSQISLYKPANGPALNVFAGRYLGEYVSVQGNFIWNSNGLMFASSSTSSQQNGYYSETRDSSQSSAMGDVLVFFRNRRSLLRPYLSVGAGWVHVQSSRREIDFISGTAAVAPPDFSANTAGLRVAVGIDVKVARGFSLRYSFSESISRNPISDQLSPPGERGLKNFQNLWGLLKTF